MKRYHIIDEDNKEVFDKELFDKAVQEESVITCNSVSGGKTSAYIAANYPADYNIFSLVRTDDPRLKFPDAKLRQMVSDRIGREFIGTLEEDEIIYTMFDLEQFIGSEITWVTGRTFDEIIDYKKALPNVMQRYCTSMMKIEPMSQWHFENIGQPTLSRIGFRANEQGRAKRMLEGANPDGIIEIKTKIGKSKSGRNKWTTYLWQKPHFPLIEDGIFKDDIHNFWEDKPVRFAWQNNCVGCFHRNPIMLKHISDKFPEKFKWFIRAEEKMKERHGDNKFGRFMKETSYQKIADTRLQMNLFDDDFNECDSGYCGL